MRPALIDSGAILALLDRSEWAHERSVRALEELRRPLVTCEAVITESCYLLRHKPLAIEAVLANVGSGFFGIPFQLASSSAQIQAILQKHRDTPADFADACLIHLADQLNTGDILTLDKEFARYRWRRTKSFRLLIPLG
ncbi:MAG: PIN domain-containing protein [Terracidiphilus sp.]